MLFRFGDAGAAKMPGNRLGTLDRHDRCSLSERSARRMSLALQLNDYRITTAEILYRLPDHPEILQTYIWQELDLAPGYPELRKFLDFWRRELDGKVHSVRVASADVITPPRYRAPGAYMHLH
jgi:uncharacterized protein Usg